MQPKQPELEDTVMSRPTDEWSERELSVYEMANELHMANTGASEPIPTGRRKELEDFIRYKLERWTTSSPLWAVAFDNAVKALLEAVLDEPMDPRQCCRRDHDFDGNCDRHPDGFPPRVQA